MRLGAILLVCFIEALVLLSFGYLVFGLWQLPMAEVVEELEALMYLFDSLQLIIIVLTILVTYRLVSFGDDNLEQIENLLQERLPEPENNKT